MFVASVLIPLQDNDGVPFHTSDQDRFRDRLLAVNDGLNIRHGIRGVWTFEGRIYDEPCEEYRSALPSIRQIPAWLEVVEWARTHFRQIAVYVELTGGADILGPPARP